MVLFGAFILVVRSVRNRHANVLAPPQNDPADHGGEASASPDAETSGTDPHVPFLETPLRVRGTVRRVFRDALQNSVLVEITVGKKRLIFRPADVPANAERYQKAVTSKDPADFAVYALATLAPGGVEAMKNQIKDWDKANAKPDMVGLISAGQFANDYAVIARIRAKRDDTVSEEPVWVYRAQVVKNNGQELFLELAADAAPPAQPLSMDALAHGSARLFGSFAVD